MFHINIFIKQNYATHKLGSQTKELLSLNRYIQEDSIKSEGLYTMFDTLIILKLAVLYALI